MTVTENDIVQNAAQIAALVNAGGGVEIGELDEALSMADTDILHVQISGIDKKIKKQNTGFGGGNPFVPVQYPAVPASGVAAGPEIDTGVDDDDNGTPKRRYQRSYVIKDLTAAVTNGQVIHTLTGLTSTWRIMEGPKGDCLTKGPRTVTLQGAYYVSTTNNVTAAVYQNQLFYTWNGFTGYTPDIIYLTIQYWKSA